ncbi:MAG TPA: hypothetical protein DEB31_11920 [Clostridiales bacterium]|nr:hypothetical protein [Clostridiales bacterium]
MLVKRKSWIVLCLVLTLVAVAAIAGLAPGGQAARAADNIVIVVDPGHGYSDRGVDSGAIGIDGTQEADLNRQLGAKIANQLKSAGYTVYSTLPLADGIPNLLPNGTVSLETRKNKVNELGPDLFISVHHDAAPGRAAGPRGTSVLYATDQLAEAMRPLSKAMATSVYQSVASLGYTVGNRAQPVTHADATVLYRTNAPAITLEAGFLTNAQDLAQVKDPAKQTEMAAKVVEGIRNFVAANPLPNRDATPPTASMIYTSESPTSAPHFNGEVSGVTDPSGVAGVRFAVYREGNTDPNKVKWYDGVDLGSDGRWGMLAQEADFTPWAGTYIIEAYATDTKNNTGAIGVTSMVVQGDASPPTATSVYTSASPTSASNFNGEVSGVTDPSGVRNVYFHVYRNGDRNTTKRYDGVYLGNNGRWGMLAQEADFAPWAGSYTIEAYATDNKGNTGSLGAASMVVQGDASPPTATSVYTSASPTSASNFNGEVSGVTDPSGVRNVYFHVYRNGDRNTTKRYDGVYLGNNGRWGMLAQEADFAPWAGNYTIEAYATDNKGNTGLLGAASMIVQGDASPPTATSVYTSASPTSASHFNGEVSGVTDPSGVAGVRFAVYREGSSPVWYDGVYLGDNGRWGMLARETDFTPWAGNYTIEVYATDAKGNTGAIGVTSMIVQGDASPPTATSVYTSASPTTTSSFNVEVSGVRDENGIAGMQYAVYVNGDQSTLKLYDGVYLGDNGRYGAVVQTADFNNWNGTYTIDAYATDNKGNRGLLGSASMIVQYTDPAEYKIMGTPESTQAQLVNYYKKSATFPQSVYGMTLEQFVEIYWQEATFEGVKPEVAFIQMCNETGFLRYGAQVTPEQLNFCGLKTRDGSVFASFPDVRTGVAAQVQHLKCYASTEPLVNSNNVDPRWPLVARGCAPTVESLGGRWAGADYGIHLRNMLNALKSVSSVATAALTAPLPDVAEQAPAETADNAVLDQEVSVLLDEQAAANDEILPEVKEETADLFKDVLAPQDAPALSAQESADAAQRIAALFRAGVEADAAKDGSGGSLPQQYGITAEEFAAMYIEAAANAGIRHEIAFAQAMVETDFLRKETGGFNMGGLADTEAPDVRSSIVAQADLLKDLAAGDLAQLDEAWVQRLLAVLEIVDQWRAGADANTIAQALNEV